MSTHGAGRGPDRIDWTLVIAILMTTVVFVGGFLAINAKSAGPDPGRVTVTTR